MLLNPLLKLVFLTIIKNIIDTFVCSDYFKMMPPWTEHALRSARIIKAEGSDIVIMDRHYPGKETP